MIPTLILSCGLASPPGPMLKIDSAFPHVGTIKIGKSITRTFLLKNAETTQSIVISQIQPGCGCVSQSLKENTTIAPGETIEWKVGIETMAQPAGERTWTIRYRVRFENDNAGIDSAIGVHARLHEEIRVSPPMVAFSTAGEASQSISIRDQRPSKKLTITSVETTHSSLAVDWKSDGTIALSLKSTASADGKTYKEAVVIRTTDPEYPELRVPVSFVKHANDSIAITPPTFEISIARSPSALVQLRERTGGLIAVRSAEAAVSGISLAFSPAKNPVTAIRATVDPALAGPSGTAIVTVTLADGAVRFIPISWK
jgi:hypothetical protein